MYLDTRCSKSKRFLISLHIEVNCLNIVLSTKLDHNIVGESAFANITFLMAYCNNHSEYPSGNINCLRGS